MSLFEALIFGLLQGLTEFLPVSSSAHLKIAKLFFNIENSESQILFDLVCHLGTLMALLYFLRHEIRSILLNDRRKLFLLCVATLVLIPCYFLLKPLRELASHPQFLGPCLIFTAIILFSGGRFRVRKQPSAKNEISDALWIGAMQSAALIPGISRSASTISCAKILGWNPKEAVRFSFLLCIPTIIGGNCLELLKIYLDKTSISISLTSCAVGFISSLGLGLIMVRFALTYLEKGNLKPFAWYCLGCGSIVTVYLNFF